MTNQPDTPEELLDKFAERVTAPSHDFEADPAGVLEEYEQARKETLTALLSIALEAVQPFHSTETPNPCQKQVGGRWPRSCDCGLEEALVSAFKVK